MSEGTSLRWEGYGLHTGSPCAVEVAASASPGIRFAFPDGASYLVQEAVPEGDGRGSSLTFPNGITIRTVEHLMSGMAGTGLWNATIRVEGPEIPGLDGSAADFSGRLRGLSKTGGDPSPEPLRVVVPVTVRDQCKTLAILPAEFFGVTCVIDYPGTWIGTQAYQAEKLDEGTYIEEISRARTFCLESELDQLKAAGLGKGGNLGNAVVVGPGGPLNPEALAYPDGFARHKVLDLVGDLALLGRPVVGHVLAFRSGHGLHLALVARLKRLLRCS